MPRPVAQTEPNETPSCSEARRAIADVALAVAEELDPKRAAHTVVQQTHRVLGADGVFLWEVAEAGRELHLLAHRGFPKSIVARLRSMSFSAPTLSSRAARTGQLQVQEDMREVAPELTITRELAESCGFRSMVAVPLKARGRLVGVMTYSTKKLQRFTPDELETVMAIGRIFAIGLDNAKAYARERELYAEVQALVAASPEGILLLEAPSGRVLLVNEATERILGRPVVPDAPISDYVQAYGLRQPNGAPYSPNELPPARAFRGQTVLGVRMLVHQPSGNEVPVLVNGAPIRDERGAIIAAVVLFQDITKLRELERQREEMASIIAHDLRAPIAVISGYADFLLSKAAAGKMPGQTRLALQRIRDSAKSLDRLVADLLDVARLETRRLALRRQWVDLPVLTRDVVARLSAALPDRPLQIDVRGEIPPVWADPGRLEQILTNLLTNAAKYADPHTEILVVVRRHDGDVEVSVSDHGRGIPPDELAHIFQRYYRGRGAGAGPEGLGLGLYITRGLVEALGGRIWVESQVGVGTTFHFTLPTKPVPGRRPRPPQAPSRRASAEGREAASRVSRPPGGKQRPDSHRRRGGAA